MYTRLFYNIASILILSFSSVIAQNSVSRPEMSSQVRDSFVLEKFAPPTTSVIVKDSSKLKIATIFSLDTPNKYRPRLGSNFHDITRKWLQEHPNSIVIEVHRYPVFPQKDTTYARESYVWVKDGGKNLNLELVRLGACDSRTMLLDEEDEANIILSRGEYLDFKQKILEAEKSAKENKLGIWKHR